MVAVTGGNGRMVDRMDMEHTSGLMETDASGNTVMIVNSGMEYTNRVMGQYITDSGKRVRNMAKDMRGCQMAMNIGESTRMK